MFRRFQRYVYSNRQTSAQMLIYTIQRCKIKKNVHIVCRIIHQSLELILLLSHFIYRILYGILYNFTLAYLRVPPAQQQFNESQINNNIVQYFVQKIFQLQ